MDISFIGAGNVASSLGEMFVQAGHHVKYGTPTPKGEQLSVSEACDFGDIVCFAIPYSVMNEVLTANKNSLKDKIVVDITNVIHLEDWSPIPLGEDSSGEQTSRLLPESKVVKAFNTIFADVMKDEKRIINGQKLTVFIASDDLEASGTIKKLSDSIGFEGLIVGGIKNARYLEAIAHLNIAILSAGGTTDAGFAYLQRK